jgi:hypothetical protein
MLPSTKAKVSGEDRGDDYDDEREISQVSHWDRCQSDGFHSAIRIYKRVELHLHLTGLWGMEYPVVMVSLDILLYKKYQLQREAKALVVKTLETFG